jgi:hypothetical protein
LVNLPRGGPQSHGICRNVARIVQVQASTLQACGADVGLMARPVAERRRMKRPVFIVGCPRSGTTLLYSMLVASGGFAVYRKETYFYDLLPRFRDLATVQGQQRFAREFLQGYLGHVPGLDVEPFVRSALDQCRRPEEFLPLLLTAITSAQQMDRWIEATPAHVLCMNEIERAVPDALFVHVIRDGRDCALSNNLQRWIPTLPWDKTRRLGVAALLWESMVRAGRAYGRANPSRYLELQFEDLIGSPSETLNRVGAFIDHDLDYDRIRQNPVHAMKHPNTSFREETSRADFNPVGRWKEKLTTDDVRLCEALVGRCLTDIGYSLAYPATALHPGARARLMRNFYMAFFTGKHALKAHTPLGRFMTSTRVWAEQPHVGERPVRPIPSTPPGAVKRLDCELMN